LLKGLLTLPREPVQCRCPNRCTTPAEDPTDAAFIDAIRDENLAPKVPASMDAGLVTDASNVCNLAAGIPGETLTVRKTDMVNMRNSRTSSYGITEAQAETVMILSTETYCPDQTNFVRSAFN
jgi:hypothetical protein